MNQERAYLDHNATSPMRPQVLATVAEACALGNPSSVHSEGRQARKSLETARLQVAALVGGGCDDVVFTSGGTEANNMVLRPGALLDGHGRPVERLLVGATEHPSVLAGHRFPAEKAATLVVDAAGLVDLGRLEEQLSGCDRPTLVSVQVANSETGVIQPVGEIAAIARSRGAVLHVDAVQAAGRLPIDMVKLGVAALSLSAHKLGGPKGAGALVVASGRGGPDLALLIGGAQERGARAGTPNVAALAGFGIAAEQAARDIPSEAARLRQLRDGAETAIRCLAPAAIVFGAAAERLPNSSYVSLPGFGAETVLMSLDLDGVAVSSGSACSSGKVGRSHVLEAMGVPADVAAGAIRLSFGWNSTQRDLDRFVGAFERLLRRLYETARAHAA